jgi:hypothetical protein
MLEHALAPYGRPHDYLQPRVSTLHWTHWNSGLVMPTEAGAKLASMEDRKPHATVDDGESERIALGEPPTLTGIIEPVALDPRTSYRPGEDPLWLDWDPGEEYDGTDAGDKDYLFGCIAHALGAVQRREDRGATIRLAWGPRVPAVLGRAGARARRVLARGVTALADLHAALGGARHHLVQYVAWRALRDEELLTARAYVPELEQKSRAITAKIDTADPVARSRIARLASAPGRPRRRRLVVGLAVGAGVVGLVALAVQAVRYHATYEERIASQRRSSDGNR